MKKISLTLMLSFLVFSISLPQMSSAARKEIKLVKPSITGGIPLMSAFNKRRSSRTFSAKKLPDQVLSDLLWSAAGVNRPDSGKRTSPSAMDRREIGIFVALEEGLYYYNAPKHTLELIADKDIRAVTGKQDFVGNAAVNLVYVADMSKVAGSDDDEKFLYAGADTGFIGQNVYLYCASAGLSTVIRGYIDRDALHKAMNLKSNQMIILSQSVGYPGK